MKLAMCGFALLLVTLGFSQQQAQPPYTTPPTFPREPQMPPDQKAPPPTGLSTTEVEKQIQEHFNAEPALANTNVGVTGDETSVVLTGTIDSDLQHELALRIAQSYVGDRKLVDKIRVTE